jgi:hypothetical protein
VIPESWRSGAGPDTLDPATQSAVEGQVGRFLDLNTRALEMNSTSVAEPSKDGANPWHLEYLVTDLSVSASGALGALLGKGSPAVSFLWRRQYERKAADQAPRAEEAPDFQITAGKSLEDVSAQLEPVIHSLVQAGLPEDTLRPKLMQVAQDFARITKALEFVSGDPWWVSRYRMDVLIEASGKVTPLLSAGGEIRLRFEWHRMMPKTTLADRREPKGDIAEFVEKLQSDVAAAALGARDLRDAGFDPCQFRIGVGYTEKGSIGIAKAQGTVIGQIYFSRGVKKPEVHPSPLASVAKGETSVFRKGLERAFKMAGIFARGARRSSASTNASRHWKLYEMRASFDVSLTGTLGLAEVGGVGTSEISFYNQEF